MRTAISIGVSEPVKRATCSGTLYEMFTGDKRVEKQDHESNAGKSDIRSVRELQRSVV